MSLLTDGEQLHRGWQPAPKARNPKPGLNDLTSCRLLDSHVLFYDCEGIPCKLRLFFFFFTLPNISHQRAPCALSNLFVFPKLQMTVRSGPVRMRPSRPLMKASKTDSLFFTVAKTFKSLSFLIRIIVFTVTVNHIVVLLNDYL